MTNDQGPMTKDGTASDAAEDAAFREYLGRQVRDEWFAWAEEQTLPKSSWLLPWILLSEPDREAARRIGERLFRAGLQSALSFRTAGQPGAVALTAGEIFQLHALREKCPKILRFLEQILASQGDAADRELIQLQHDLAELLRPRVSVQTERSNQT